MRPALLTALFLLPLSARPARAAEPVIRVAIVRGAPSLKLKTSDKVFVTEVKTGERFQLLPKAQYEIKAAGAAITVAGQQLSSPVKLLASAGGERMRLGGRIYKGDILLLNSGGGRLDIVEALPVEDYLYGVLASEMSPDWPLEALKAQAVASRTYAVKQINPSREFDITNGVEKQVYKGNNGTYARIIDAVDSTRGEVLKYRGKLVTAFFHACCGGHTASVSSAWGEGSTKPLAGVPDSFCRPSSHYRWRLMIPGRSLLAFVQKQGSAALKLKSVRIHKKDKSGRALSLKFTTDQGSLTATAKDLRSHFGTFEFRSTFITGIEPVKGGYEFSGRGWGHVVGMCQDGAKQQAYKGRTYRRILKHYYPGAAVSGNYD